MTRLKRKKALASTNTNDIRFGTPQDVAAYRAKRIAELAPHTIIEVGAGAGFQTSELAKSAQQVIAVEVDKERLSRATFPSNVHALPGDALDPKIIEHAQALAKGDIAVFLDPERPPSARQRKLAEIKPDILEFLRAYRQITADIAIELPPFLDEIPFPCEREYLSVDGKLNRLTVYTGRLRRCDISVIRLPGEQRFEHSGAIPPAQAEHVSAKFVLEPDAALSHAGLAHVALQVPFRELQGKRTLYLTEQVPASAFFTAFKILAQGQERVLRFLPVADCGTIILHGELSQDEQRTLLHQLNKLCKGKGRLHLFLPDWILTRKIATG